MNLVESVEFLNEPLPLYDLVDQSISDQSYVEENSLETMHRPNLFSGLSESIDAKSLY